MATIQGQCASCSLYFDVRNGLGCPHCKNQMASVPHISVDGVACMDSCPACIWLNEEAIRKSAEPEVLWLEKLMSLEDKR